MKISVCQFNVKLYDKQANFERVSQMLENIDSDLVVLPELFNIGYYYDDINAVKHLSEDFNNSETIDFLKYISNRENVAIIGGFAEKAKDKLFNSSAFVNGSEKILYRKLHLFKDEFKFFTPGDLDLVPFNYKDATLGMLICFDWIFPEAMRTLTLRGAQIICHSANLVMPYCQAAMITRSIENRVFIATANRIGEDKNRYGSLKFTGQSQIVAPGGQRLGVLKDNEEKLLTFNIDPKNADNKFINEINSVISDRREGFYQ